MKHPSNRAERRHHRNRVIADRRAKRICFPQWPEQVWGHYSKWNGNCGSTICHSGKYFKEKRKRRRALNLAGNEELNS